MLRQPSQSSVCSSPIGVITAFTKGTIFEVVAGALDTGDEEADRLVHLRRREPDPLVFDHRLDHVVDQLLEAGGPDFRRIERARLLPEHRMPHARDLEYRHAVPVRQSVIDGSRYTS